VPTWLLVLGAILLGALIWRIGLATIRSFSLPQESRRGEDPEDVEDLDVYLVCRVCGTELKVSRLGELQIPRHCGETMLVVQRPAT
jgi:hypothetical protein